jgi:hypothetical protein
MHLIETLRAHAIETIQIVEPKLTARSATRLLDVHLDPRNYAMPIHAPADERALVALCTGPDDLARAHELVHFEPVQTIRGICRVMARTHLNRTGIGAIRIGAAYPTMSARLLRIFDAARSDDELRAWGDFTPLVDTLLAVARGHRGRPCDEAFDDDDIRTLEILRGLSALEARRLPKTALPAMPKSNWEKVVRGLSTGVLFLRDHYDFSATRVWDTIGRPLSFAEVQRLTAEAQQAVREFGPALAPSFFADLGSPYFVKPDTHVIDVATWVSGRGTTATPAEAIAFVHRLAIEVGYAPRTVDKIMYFACSANLYLAGLQAEKGVALRRKEALERKLRRLGQSNHRDLDLGNDGAAAC